MKKCLEPTCGRLDDEIGQCGAPGLCPHRKGSLTPPADVDTSGHDVILTLGDVSRVVAVEQLISGRRLTVNGFGEIMDKSQVRAYVPSARQGKAQDGSSRTKQPKHDSVAPQLHTRGISPDDTGGAETNGEQS